MTALRARQWWPEHLLDEITPPGATDPSAWLTLVDGQILFGRIADEETRKDYAADGVPCSFGDVLDLAFVDDLGTRMVTFHAEGGFDVEGGEPEGWNQIWDEDEHEDAGDDLAQHAANLREWENFPLTQKLRFLKWGEAKFTVVMDGERPALRVVAPEPAEGP